MDQDLSKQINEMVLPLCPEHQKILNLICLQRECQSYLKAECSQCQEEHPEHSSTKYIKTLEAFLGTIENLTKQQSKKEENYQNMHQSFKQLSKDLKIIGQKCYESAENIQKYCDALFNPDNFIREQLKNLVDTVKINQQNSQINLKIFQDGLSTLGQLVFLNDQKQIKILEMGQNSFQNIQFFQLLQSNLKILDQQVNDLLTLSVNNPTQVQNKFQEMYFLNSDLTILKDIQFDSVEELEEQCLITISNKYFQSIEDKHRIERKKYFLKDNSKYFVIVMKLPSILNQTILKLTNKVQEIKKQEISEQLQQQYDLDFFHDIVSRINRPGSQFFQSFLKINNNLQPNLPLIIKIAQFGIETLQSNPNKIISDFFLLNDNNSINSKETDLIYSAIIFEFVSDKFQFSLAECVNLFIYCISIEENRSTIPLQEQQQFKQLGQLLKKMGELQDVLKQNISLEQQ